jgi:hypothetical protein
LLPNQNCSKLIDNKNKRIIQQAISFLNATIKSVEGLGERSAFGLPDENGGIIIKLEANSPLKKQGYRKKMS